ncbi:hypothetical protein [Psychroserpens algicola]|uniref:Uncharacterized protein n=1 Tax=Psychroserpens algicola TaxID=1719034 RepID=A0ABT0H5I7_9FLAO|nr:hypothetical protein [Psychroserpens algicola]MCK8479062.1 hypothetical protein [Psychroserpens algicola]
MSKKKNKSKGFKVVQYSRENLLDVLFYGSYSKREIQQSYLYEYLCNFLRYRNEFGHNVKTMVIEEKYLSESYFKDFKNYFAESFNNYSKFTKRIHFFCNEIENNKRFEQLIVKNSSALTSDELEILESYIGYTVIKPISSAFLGATFLEPYPPTIDNPNIERHYNSIKEQKINLFGKELSLFGCAFQEQDKVVSACATAALWSALYITNRIFGNSILSPSEITKSAGLSSSGNRTFPNKGLQNRQISKVLKKVGLVSELRYHTHGATIVENQNLKRIIYAYNKMNIPILIGYSNNGEIQFNQSPETELVDELSFSISSEVDDNEFELEQHHLVVVLGYKINNKIENDSLLSEQDSNSDGINLKADKIYKLYSHNDQIGPYVRVQLGEKQTNEIIAWEIGNKYQRANVTSVIVPLIDNIRVKFEDVLSSVQEISDIANDAVHILNEVGLFKKDNIEWDVYLTKSNYYKEEILTNSKLTQKMKSKIAFTSYPKYLWLAKCYFLDDNRTKLLDVIYDPSDSPTGFCCFQANFFNANFAYEFIESMNETFNQSSNMKAIEGGLQVLTENHKKFFEDAYNNNEDQFLDELKKV